MATRYLALLRGINVGTHGRIHMDALRHMIEDAGFTRVETYIQSGNVLFDSDLSEQSARQALERALREQTGIETTAVLRMSAELNRLVDGCPFSAEQIAAAEAAGEGERLFVCLLTRPPSAEALAALPEADAEGDQFAISGREIYLLLRQSIRNSQLAGRLQRAFPDATVRGWTTMIKLRTLLSPQDALSYQTPQPNSGVIPRKQAEGRHS